MLWLFVTPTDNILEYISKKDFIFYSPLKMSHHLKCTYVFTNNKKKAFVQLATIQHVHNNCERPQYDKRDKKRRNAVHISATQFFS